MGYDATHAGLVMSPSGIFTMMILPVVGWLLGRGIDARRIVFAGLLLMSAGAYWMAHTNLLISPWQVVWPRVVQMVGAGMCFAPLNTTAYTYLPKEQNNYATGLYNLLRNEGGSVGTSLAVTLLARREQFHALRLGEHINTLNRVTMEYWQQMTQYFQATTSSLKHAQMMGWAAINQQLQRQAAALSYYDVFYVFSLLALALIPLLFVMRPAVAAKGAHVAAE
jgi:DHA2 family multidrug resistance protein